jgi:hypothetical protein
MYRSIGSQRGSLLGWFDWQKPRSAMQPVQSLASSLTLSAGNAAPRLVRDNDNAVGSLSHACAPFCSCLLSCRLSCLLACLFVRFVLGPCFC